MRLHYAIGNAIDGKSVVNSSICRTGIFWTARKIAQVRTGTIAENGSTVTGTSGLEEPECKTA